MITEKKSLYVFGGLLEGNTETNELWQFDIGSSTWTKIHGFYKMEDPLECESPTTGLKRRGKRKQKNYHSTMKYSNIAFRRSVGNSPTNSPSPTLTRTNSLKALRQTRRPK